MVWNVKENPVACLQINDGIAQRILVWPIEAFDLYEGLRATKNNCGRMQCLKLKTA